MKKYLSILIICTLAVGCAEDWLTLFPNSSFSDETAIRKVSDGRAAMYGAYARIRSTDLYGRNIFVIADAGGQDVVIVTDHSNRYTTHSSWLNLTPSNANNGEVWRGAYNAIKRANEVILRLTDLTPDIGESEEVRDQIVGEAYFLRALMHYELVKFFSHAYNFKSDASHMGVPYIKESTMEVNHARNSVKEVFDFIIEDCETALDLMNVDRTSNRYTAGKDAVRALLARVYLYKASTRDGASYAKAAQIAEELINSARYTLVNATNYKITGSNTAFASANMWGADFSTESIFVLPYLATENNGTDALARIYLDNSKGYGDLKPSENIIALIDEDDSRSTIFYQFNSRWCNRKFMGNGTTNWAINNLNIFRLSEMYLIAAEGNMKASSPNEAKALTFLNTLKTNRGAATVNLSGAPLTSEIIAERRRELCFEGHSLSDHKRLNMSIVRGTDVTNPEYQKWGLVYNPDNPDYRWAFPIPTTEMQTNELMEQNDGY